MSRQRVCDLDGTIINPATDLFYTVMDSRTGRNKDICYQCSRSNGGTPMWAAAVTKVPGDRVRKTAGAMGKWVWFTTGGGTTGTTEPTWPTVANGFVVDGTVTWYAELAPNNLTTLKVKLPGQPVIDTDIYGWVSGTNEVL